MKKGKTASHKETRKKQRARYRGYHQSEWMTKRKREREREGKAKNRLSGLECQVFIAMLRT